MSLQVFHPAGPECIGPGIMPNVGAVAAMTAQFNRVQVRLGTDPENADQLMLASAKAALPCIGFYPGDLIEHRPVDAPSGGDQFLDVAPIHAGKMHGAVRGNRDRPLQARISESR
jgi:hypothetical protein